MTQTSQDLPALLAALASTLQARGWMLATAESCTGGLIAGACTELAGSSLWFERGFVSYSNAAKTELLGVPAALIAQHGAVSEAVARAMAEGALAHSAAQVSIAVTGVAGPSGGSADKPVGTVWLAWCVGGHTYSQCQHFAGNRQQVRAATVAYALEHLLVLLATPAVPALILAAGRGERMRPLTDHTPKPLLAVQGQPLLQWHLQALVQAGVARAIINTAWLGEHISRYFGAVFPSSGHTKHRLALSYSREEQDFGHALETAGGIARALPQLGDIFWLVAGDVFVPGFCFAPEAVQAFAASQDLAHLWLVPNPAHHPQGDFGLSPEGRALNLPETDPAPRYTYSTIALLRAELFTPPWCDIAAGNPQGIAAPLAPVLRRAMDAGRVGASLYHGAWTDVGTPERLAQLNAIAPA
jgi:N-acetyl-alpha-D-muramate 1-phosphate uridylyltransferase